MGFGIPQADWLRNELAELVSANLLSKSAFISNYINMINVEQAILRHYKGANQDRVIWPLLILELWANNRITN
jgi:hypothetical protein